MYKWMWMFSGLSTNGKVGVVIVFLIIASVFFCMLPFLYQIVLGVLKMFWRIGGKAASLCIDILTAPVYFLIRFMQLFPGTRRHQASVVPIVKETQTNQTLYRVILEQDRNRDRQ